MNYKFTQDGKKVIVVGTLNTKETIVQEIFEADGTEFPAGEHFVVKTLLDVPAETYQSKQKKRIESEILNLGNKREQLKNEIKEFSFKAKAAAEKIKWIQGIKEDEVKTVVEYIKAVICGEYTHVVFNDYKGIKIEKWNDECFSKVEGFGEGKRFEGIKLVSLFGFWNKRLALNWKVNSYSDGSGSYKSFIPCKSLQEALEKVKEIIDSKDTLSDSDYKVCIKYSLPIDEVKNSARIERTIQNFKEQIEGKRKQISELEIKLGKYLCSKDD